MQDLQVFTSEQFGEIRVVIINDNPWWVGKDVCEALNISNSRDAVTRLDDDEKDVAIIDTLGGSQPMVVISESGLYSLILTSRKPEAKAFKRWITHDVLPSIQKHGAYMTDATIESLLTNPDLLIGLATQLKEERTKTEALALKIAEDAPKVDFCERVLETQNSFTATVIAKDYGMSAYQLNKFLHEQGVQYKQGNTWVLYRAYDGQGYTDTKTHVIDDDRSTIQLRWTQKGRKMISELIFNTLGIYPALTLLEVAK